MERTERVVRSLFETIGVVVVEISIGLMEGEGGISQGEISIE